MRGPKKKLRQVEIDAAKPQALEYTLWDYPLTGFGLRVRPTGAHAYVYLYRPPNHRKVRRVTIGKPGELTLEEARGEAKKLAAQVCFGHDPATIKVEGRRTTLEALVKEYERDGLSECCTAHQVRVRGIFKSKVIPKLGGHPIGTIMRSDVRLITSILLARGKKAMANNVHRTVSAFLSWCVDREYISVNPLYGAALPHRARSRQRNLTPKELVNLWKACDQLDPRWRAAIRLLILTGQRKSEVLGAKCKEFDLVSQEWTIPAHRTKNRHSHSVYLSMQALTALRDVPQTPGQQFVFTSHTTEPPRPLSEPKWVVRQLRSLVRMPDWHLHDLRRSVATQMAKLKVAPHVIEVVLNHRSGFRSGVAGVYNVYPYEEEAREAWELWGSTLESWIKENTVIPGTEDDDAVVI